MKAIITGMHRSGTSMVTGLLQRCGLHLGSNLISGLVDNPKGHYEDRTFVRINDALLAINGGSWHTPPKEVRITERIWGEMLRFVASWPTNKPVGWKDPRACLTLHLWARAIAHEGQSLRVVVVNRRFDEVAASLKARNGFEEDRSRELCFTYMREMMRNIQGQRWCVTIYSDYFNDWTTALGEVVDFLDLRMPDDPGPLREFIESRLWHHRAEDPA